ncbi:MAG: 50S ribosomal protein L29 [Nitrospinae bacterium]|nr:50S ribosomal protein L29 [Nitrospinota bacterium]
MKAEEIRQMTKDERTAKLEDIKKEYLNLRFGRATQQLEKSSQIRQARRNIARIHTINNEKKKA